MTTTKDGFPMCYLGDGVYASFSQRCWNTIQTLEK